MAVDPGYWFALVWRARVRLQMGQTGQARTDAELALQLSGGENVHALVATAMAVARAGDTDAAQALVERALGSGVNPATLARFVPMALVALGDIDRALSLLESVRTRDVLLRAALRMPEFDAVRDHPRFQALLARD